MQSEEEMLGSLTQQHWAFLLVKKFASMQSLLTLENALKLKISVTLVSVNLFPGKSSVDIQAMSHPWYEDFSVEAPQVGWQERGWDHWEFHCPLPVAQLKTHAGASFWLGNLGIEWYICSDSCLISKASQNADSSNSKAITECLIWFVSKLRMGSLDVSRRTRGQRIQAPSSY